MARPKKFGLHLLLAAAASVAAAAAAGQPAQVTLLLVLDGFRHDYYTSYDTPNLDRMASDRRGAFVADVTPAFPSSRYPNVASLATGAYAEQHNVLDEQVFSKTLGRVVFSNEPDFWNDTRNMGTIWQLHSQGAGVRHAKVFGFPDSKPLLDPPRPSADAVMDDVSDADTEEAGQAEEAAGTKSKAAGAGNDDAEDAPAPTEQDWPRLLRNLQSFVRSGPAGGHPFATLFLDEPGMSARVFGPESAEAAVKKVDDFVGQILDWMHDDKEGLADRANLVVASTPGYADVPMENVINLDKYVSREYKRIGNSPVLNIQPTGSTGDALEIFSELEQGESSKKYQVFLRRSVPERWHYAQSAGFQSMVLVANRGCVFSADFMAKISLWNRQFNRTGDLDNIYGCNGYDNDLMDMHTPLFALGPAFLNDGAAEAAGKAAAAADSGLPGSADRNETKGARVDFVDVFALLCHVLDLDEGCLDETASASAESAESSASAGGKRNASIDSLAHILAHPPDETIPKRVVKYLADPEHWPITLSLAIATFVVLISFACVLIAKRRQRRKMLAQQGFRYTQVRNNRRLGKSGGGNGGGGGHAHELLDEEDDDDEDGDGGEDKQRLLMAPSSGGSAGAARVGGAESSPA